MITAREKAQKGPAEEILERPPEVLSDAELLALLLGNGYRGCNARQLAGELLDHFGGLAGVLRADRSRLLASPGVGPAKYALLCAALEVSRRHALDLVRGGDVLSSPQQTRRFLQHHLAGRTREIFSCLFVDSQNRLICCEDLFLGTIDGAAVYPREVAIRALQNSAAAVIFAHNHPSGITQPSVADRRITERLQSALGLLDIRVLDHIIVGSGTPFSFAEVGLL
ncbi:MAG: DNA repair protein RadC [Halieaceae bacterium]|mgnify:CR=1 FL=1|nr:DNA repair protein RadC [Halieaceae bacterium]